MKKDKIRKYQDIVLKKLAGRIDDFYLAGGTALALFYFQHRISVDLDFFTQDFSSSRIMKIVDYLRQELSGSVELVGENMQNKNARMMVYNVLFTSKDALKVDFVEDIIKLLKPTKIVEGIRVLSLEDIYLRKLYAICGVIPGIDTVGRRKVAGGRVSAKDFYDIYILSQTFKRLSRFIGEYGDTAIKEGVIRWFRSYDRMRMIDEVLALDVDRDLDYRKIERHFKKEIDKVIESQLGDI